MIWCCSCQLRPENRSPKYFQMLPWQLWKLESSHQGVLIASEGGVHVHSTCLGSSSAMLLHHALILFAAGPLFCQCCMIAALCPDRPGITGCSSILHACHHMCQCSVVCSCMDCGIRAINAAGPLEAPPCGSASCHVVARPFILVLCGYPWGVHIFGCKICPWVTTTDAAHCFCRQRAHKPWAPYLSLLLAWACCRLMYRMDA